MRAAIPQVVTTARVLLGAAALVASFEGHLVLAATCITLGAATDGIDGQLSRWLSAETPTGALLDYFADYLCFVIAPWGLTRALLTPANVMHEALLALPLVTGAFRYAQNGAIVAREREAPDLVGAGTLFFAFVSVTAVFLEARSRLPASVFVPLITAGVVVLALLMIAPVRYPKLVRFRVAGPVVIVLLTLMPFVATQLLAWMTVVLGVGYVVVAPVWARWPGPDPDLPDPIRDRGRR